jgi:hypothetical protein
MKLSVLQIIKEEVENFFNDTLPNGQPGMADNYYDKFVGASTPKPQTPGEPKISGELIGSVDKQWNEPLETPIPVYKNPINLMGFSNNARGVLLNNGDLYLGLSYNALHKNILDLLAEKNIVPYNKISDYNVNLPKEFIAVTRVMHTNNFSDSSEYSSVQFPEYYKQIFNLANQKQPYKFMPLPRSASIKEIESPLDPNLQISNIPAGHKFNILDGKTEEKYYLATDKTGRGEKPIKLTRTQIENNWELDEVDWFDVPLGEYLEESYIGDVWETRTEKLECIEIH